MRLLCEFTRRSGSLTAVLFHVAASFVAAGGLLLAADASESRRQAIESNNLGIALLAQFKPADAEAELKKALAGAPDYVPALVNLGIAQLAQVRYDEAVESFLRALLSDPGNIHAHYNLSLIYKIQGKTADGIREAMSALAGDPRNGDLHYNLASLHQAGRDFDKAIEGYKTALKINSSLLPAYYALGRAYIAKGDMTQGRKYIMQHQALSAASNLPASSAGLRYGEQGHYSMAMDDPAMRSSRAAPLKEGRITFVDVSADSGILFGHAGGGEPHQLRSPISTAAGVQNLIRDRVAPVLGGGVSLTDLNGDGAEDLVFVNTLGKPAGVFFNQGKLKFAAVAASAAAIPVGSGMGVASGDVDNDGYPDLVVSRYGSVSLLINDGRGGLTPQKLPPLSTDTLASGISLADVDHDGDLDIFVNAMLALPNPPKPRLKFPDDFGGDRIHLFRNNGNGTWTDIAADAGFDDGVHRNVGAIFSDFDNDRDIDVAVSRLGSGLALFANNRDGSRAGLPQKGNFLGLCAGDYNRDGFMDLLATSWDGSLPRLFRNNGNGSFALDVSALANVPRPIVGPLYGCAFTDIDNDGLLDALVVNGGDKGAALLVLRNLGNDGFEDAGSLIGIGSLPARRGRGTGTLTVTWIYSSPTMAPRRLFCATTVGTRITGCEWRPRGFTATVSGSGPRSRSRPGCSGRIGSWFRARGTCPRGACSRCSDWAGTPRSTHCACSGRGVFFKTRSGWLPTRPTRSRNWTGRELPARSSTRGTVRR